MNQTFSPELLGALHLQARLADLQSRSTQRIFESYPRAGSPTLDWLYSMTVTPEPSAAGFWHMAFLILGLLSMWMSSSLMELPAEYIPQEALVICLSSQIQNWIKLCLASISNSLPLAEG
ncbi:hypothetical protein FA95DRAFT_1026909 [Auriscalpium vulgare]|uniref:Uncharacterized protein n=1 Tax=Auriscalpium vulgare TaxID=40419 RepID=A0ACB8RX02_9AGAM|nr:hypothetical protein FA95DRAFT_1026909 [Auriscalpium vulgare]